MLECMVGLREYVWKTIDHGLVQVHGRGTYWLQNKLKSKYILTSAVDFANVSSGVQIISDSYL